MAKAAPRLTRFITVKDFAEQLGVSERTVARWIKDGSLHVHHFGALVRIAEDDAWAFIAKHRR